MSARSGWTFTSPGARLLRSVTRKVRERQAADRRAVRAFTLRQKRGAGLNQEVAS